MLIPRGGNSDARGPRKCETRIIVFDLAVKDFYLNYSDGISCPVRMGREYSICPLVVSLSSATLQCSCDGLSIFSSVQLFFVEAARIGHIT